MCAWRASQANGFLAEIPHFQRKEAEISKREQSERLITEEKPTRQRWAMDEVQVSFVFASFLFVFSSFSIDSEAGEQEGEQKNGT